jgi:hypothetical protein
VEPRCYNAAVAAVPVSMKVVIAEYRLEGGRLLRLVHLSTHPESRLQEILLTMIYQDAVDAFRDGMAGTCGPRSAA